MCRCIFMSWCQSIENGTLLCLVLVYYAYCALSNLILFKFNKSIYLKIEIEKINI